MHEFARERSEGDGALALAVTEVAFLDAAHDPTTYPGGDPTSWVCTMAERRLAGDVGAGPSSLPEDDPAERAQAVAAVAALSPDDAAVLSMRFLDRLSITDIADHLGRSETSVEEALARGTGGSHALPDRGTVDRVQWALRALEAGPGFPAGRADALFDQIAAALTPEDRVWQLTRVRGTHRRARILVYALVIAMTATVVLIVRPERPPGAREIVAAAQRHYLSMPAFEAEVVRRDGSDATATETVRRVEFRDTRHWRTRVLSSTRPQDGGFAAADGSTVTVSLGTTGKAWVTSLAELAPGTLAAIATGGLDPMLHTLRLTRSELRSGCVVGEGSVIRGRAVATLDCELRSTRLAMDRRTGLVLDATTGTGARAVHIYARRLQSPATVAPDIGVLTAAEKEQARWVGVGPPPPRFRVAGDPEVAEVRAAAAGAGSLAEGDGDVFVLGWTQVPDPFGDLPPQRLVRIDASRRRVRWSVPISPHASSVATTAGVVWVTGTDTRTAFLERRDPQTGKLLGPPLRRPGHSTSLVADDDHVWFSGGPVGERRPKDGVTLVRIDPASGRQVGSISVTGLVPVPLVLDGARLWLVARDPGPVAIQFDSTSGRETGRVPLPEEPAAIDVDGGTIWAAVVGRAEGAVGQLVAVDGTSGRVVRRIEVGPLPTGIVAEPGGVWVITQGDSRLTGFDPRTGAVLKRVVVGGTGLRGLVRVGAELWTADFREGLMRAAPVPRT